MVIKKRVRINEKIIEWWSRKEEKELRIRRIKCIIQSKSQVTIKYARWMWRIREIDKKFK